MTHQKTIVLTIIAICLLQCHTSAAQRIDTLDMSVWHTGDIVYTVKKISPEKYRFLGNSWYVSGAYTYATATTQSFELNIGRSLGRVNHAVLQKASSWGLGYGFTDNKGKPTHSLRLFGEMGSSIFLVPLLGVRGEYIYDLTNQNHYLRPSVGLYSLLLDIFYSYSFRLQPNTPNLYKHGITLRLKYFHRIKNWEQTYSVRARDHY